MIRPGNSDRMRINLGRRCISVCQMASLKPGAIIELDKPAGDHVEVFLGSRLHAKGNLVCIDGKLCVRVCQAVDASAATVQT